MSIFRLPVSLFLLVTVILSGSLDNFQHLSQREFVLFPHLSHICFIISSRSSYPKFGKIIVICVFFCFLLGNFAEELVAIEVWNLLFASQVSVTRNVV